MGGLSVKKKEEMSLRKTACSSVKVNYFCLCIHRLTTIRITLKLSMYTPKTIQFFGYYGCDYPIKHIKNDEKILTNIYSYSRLSI